VDSLHAWLTSIVSTLEKVAKLGVDEFYEGSMGE
jgi:hypothetical protein